MNRKDLFAAFAMHALMQEQFARLRNDEIGAPWSDQDIAAMAHDLAEAMCHAEAEKEMARAVNG